MKRIKPLGWIVIASLILLISGLLTSCTDAGTTEKFKGVGSDTVKYKPPVIHGDTLELFQYYYCDGSPIWIAWSRNHSTTSLTYRVGKHDESVIIVNGDEFRRIKGSVIMENDSLVLLKKSK